MDQWLDIARENWAAARDLLSSQMWRSSISRAYYAVYAAATAKLVDAGVDMPAGREGPSHARLPQLVVDHLGGIDRADRGRLFGLIQLLYNLRLIADYRPTSDVQDGEGRNAYSAMRDSFRLMQAETP